MPRRKKPSTLCVRLFGKFRAEVDGRPVADWKRPQAQSIVKVLALEPTHQLHREQLVEHLWPHLDPAAAENSFNKNLSYARRALEPALAAGSKSSFIVTERELVRLTAPQKLWVDVDEFERAAKAALNGRDVERCEAALGLYAGDLLVENLFDDWAAYGRESLKSLLQELLSHAAGIYEAQGRYDRAVDCLQRLLRAESSDEGAHRALMRLYFLSGDRRRALAQYKLCEKTLGEELGVSPEDETIELYRSVKADVREAVAGRGAGVRPDFDRITNELGTVRAARSTRDARQILCAAAWRGRPPDVYAYRYGAEWSPLGLEGAYLLAVSPSGEVALALRRHPVRGYVNVGELAFLRPDGTLLETSEEVHYADWSPDGRDLAVVRDHAGKNRLEYPSGVRRFETAGWLSHPRVSPKSRDLVAFLHHPLAGDDGGSVLLHDVSTGTTTPLSTGWSSLQGLAWSPDGDEVWFTASAAGNYRALHAVTLGGHQRAVYRALGTLTLHDISADGRVLISRDNTQLKLSLVRPESGEETDYSYRDWSVVRDLTDDGRMLLFTEAGEAGGREFKVYTRLTDGSNPRLIGRGSALALSPHDGGRYALVLKRESTPRLALLATDSQNVDGGKRRVDLPPSKFTHHPWGAWLPEGGRILFVGSDSTAGTQLYLQDLRGGEPSLVTSEDEGVFLSTPHAVSPDGKLVAVTVAGGRVVVYNVKGGGRRVIPGLDRRDAVIRWHKDLRSLYVFRRGDLPAVVRRVDLQGRTLEECFELAPEDRIGVQEIFKVITTPCLDACAYTYVKDISELFLTSVEY